MARSELNAVVEAIRELSWAHRREVMRRLKAMQAAQEARDVLEERLGAQPSCPHCRGMPVVRNGMAKGLQRYLCRGCKRTFNALTGTALARLRYRERWVAQAQVLIDGLSISKAAAVLDVARSTAFRWRHRFLSLPHRIKSSRLGGIVEADETCMLKSVKGQRGKRAELGRPARCRGGRASHRGMSTDHDIVLVVRDRSGRCTDQIVAVPAAADLAAVMRPVLDQDAVLCTDGSPAMAMAARLMGVQHQALNLRARQRVRGPWHINNVNAYHSRLKTWLRRFHGVASSYLPHYLGWFRALDSNQPSALTPATLLALAVGP